MKENTASLDLCEDPMGQLLPMKMSRSSYDTCTGSRGINREDVAAQADWSYPLKVHHNRKPEWLDKGDTWVFYYLLGKITQKEFLTYFISLLACKEHMPVFKVVTTRLFVVFPTKRKIS